MSTIGSRIRQLRKELKLTQFDFSEAIEIKQSPLSQIESDRILPSLETLIKIRRVFNISYDWILEGVHRNASKDTSESSEVLFQKLMEVLNSNNFTEIKEKASFQKFDGYLDDKINARVKSIEEMTHKLYKKLEGKIFEDELLEEIKASDKKLKKISAK